MARPKKEGLDYFPLDVYLDDKFKFIEIKYKLEGFAIVIKLLQKIYANSYFTSWGEDEELLFADEVRVDLSILKNVTDECLKREIFNEHLYEKYKILTSSGIQKRFLEATKKRTSIAIKKEYDLISEEKTAVKGEETPVNSTESTQSKVKESKVKKSKVKESSDTYSKAIDLCKYYSELLPGQDITAHLATLKIFIDIYGYDWTKEALQKTVSNKKKFIKGYIEKILQDWKANGKEEARSGSIRANNETSEDKQEYDFSCFGE